MQWIVIVAYGSAFVPPFFENEGAGLWSGCHVLHQYGKAGRLLMVGRDPNLRVIDFLVVWPLRGCVYPFLPNVIVSDPS